MNNKIPLISCSTSVRHRVKHVCRICSSSLVTKRGHGPVSSATPPPAGNSTFAGDANGESIATLEQHNAAAAVKQRDHHIAFVLFLPVR